MKNIDWEKVATKLDVVGLDLQAELKRVKSNDQTASAISMGSAIFIFIGLSAAIRAGLESDDE